MSVPTVHRCDTSPRLGSQEKLSFRQQMGPSYEDTYTDWATTFEAYVESMFDAYGGFVFNAYVKPVCGAYVESLVVTS